MSGTPETYMPANESNDDDRAPLMSPQSIKTQPVTVPANPTKTPTTLDEIQRLKKEYDDLQAELIRTTNTEYESRLNASEAQLKKFIRDLDKRQ
ncbi:MAG TPA: hypothetical protein VD770_02630, partial [Coxiellaceae bacterium]|nr:hypothetical protein [Coxiellaceae bacterium]